MGAQLRQGAVAMAVAVAVAVAVEATAVQGFIYISKTPIRSIQRKLIHTQTLHFWPFATKFLKMNRRAPCMRANLMRLFNTQNSNTRKRPNLRPSVAPARENR